MTGKVALVTGAGSGIGRASAIAFAREGAKVVVSDISAEGGEETVRRIVDAGGEAQFVRADVTNAGEVEALVRQTVERYGRLDCAHNNAGVAGASAATAEAGEEDWDRILGVNLKGVWLSMKHEIRQMVTQRSGAIVNASATAGLVGSRRSAAFSAAAHGVLGLTKTAALEYIDAGIRVNAICPGIIRTPMIERLTRSNVQAEAAFIARVPAGRMGTPEEIAEAVVWLCSDAASFVTGHAMVADGGMVAQ
jgi:NAD(P)-dependent dehydrogenase (short-subunit alcohol dehydrogenase family)